MAGDTAASRVRLAPSHRRRIGFNATPAGSAVAKFIAMMIAKTGTYGSRQLGHKDASTTLRIDAHGLPDPSSGRLVDSLDDTSHTSPRRHRRRPPRRFKTR